MALRHGRLALAAIAAGLSVACSALIPSPLPSADQGSPQAITPGTSVTSTGGSPFLGSVLTNTPVGKTPVGAPTSRPSLATPANASEPFKLRVPVHMYHRIRCVGEDPGPKTNSGLRICPELFEEQLAALRDKGWQSITGDDLADLMAKRQCPAPRTFVISIDDGAVDGYDNAAPIMEKLGFRGTYYLVAKRGEDEERRITWDQARELLARGHGIGNHSWSHRSIGRGDPRELYVEIEQAQQEFEKQLGFRPRTFVYPYGSYGPGAIRQLDESKLELAFTTEAGGVHSTEAPLVSPRVRVKPSHSGADLLRSLEKWAEPCPANPSPSPRR